MTLTYELTNRMLPPTVRSTRDSQSTVRYETEKWHSPPAPANVACTYFRFSDNYRTVISERMRISQLAGVTINLSSFRNLMALIIIEKAQGHC